MTENGMREAIAEFGRSMFDRGLTAGSSGNISARVEDGWLLTPTNACLGRLDPGRISKLDWDGRPISGDPPSKEAPLHLAMYQERAAAGAVVHLHSTYSAAVSCMKGLPAASCIPPLTAYFVMKIGRLPLVPYHRPGDPRLGGAIRGLAAKHSSVLLANHGPVVSGATLEAATYAIEELEETAKLFLLLQGQEVSPLDEPKIRELAEVFHLQVD
ncbi:MAG: 3-oxo-tetronate 4-phosphate decarboxylase [Bryobacteraceae bacterium]|jgi:ribulose-5-phosphate 4-epimerase/fuculose-1-phosphate aldolase